jgi:hypothetical protein
MPTQGYPNGVTIDVVYTNHCFSEGYDADLHDDDAVEVMDGPRKRVFCPIRYGLSTALPVIIEALPTAKVYLTPEANFVHIAARNDGGEGDYRMFLRLKRAAAAADHHLRMVVESAYSPEPGQALRLAAMTKIRFALLVDKTMHGEKVKPHLKR